MKVLLALGSLSVFIAVGCAHKKDVVFRQVPSAGSMTTSSSTQLPTSGGASASSSTNLIVTPSSRLTGKVVTYNDAGRFVILVFPVGHLPTLEQRLFVYRAGLKVGEIKVTGPQRDDHIVADLTMGEAKSGDEVRDK